MLRWATGRRRRRTVEIVGRFARFLQNALLPPNTVAAHARDLTFFRFLDHCGLGYDVIGRSKRQALAAVG